MRGGGGVGVMSRVCAYSQYKKATYRENIRKRIKGGAKTTTQLML
jgi:hypothetical protein